MSADHVNKEGKESVTECKARQQRTRWQRLALFYGVQVIISLLLYLVFFLLLYD